MDPGKHNETSTLTYMGTCTQHNSYQIQKSRTTQGKTRLKTPYMSWTAIQRFLWLYVIVLCACHTFMGMSHFRGYVTLLWVCHTFVGMSHFCGYVTLSWLCHTFMVHEYVTLLWVCHNFVGLSHFCG